MEGQEGKQEKLGETCREGDNYCCSEKGKCGCHCCGRKLIGALLLILLGGIGGFLLGRCSGYFHSMCWTSVGCPHVQSMAPQVPAK